MKKNWSVLKKEITKNSMPEIKRTWSVPTSPRSPYKLPDELKLLRTFEGQKWNRETQRAFARQLEVSEFFEGSVYQQEPDFSARDRINRSPKTFGFVRFDDENKIKITKAGEVLIKEKGETELFLRQLLKWQYPSPKHHGNRYQGFNIKPFLETLRFVYELDGLSKKEIAIFCLPLIDFKSYNSKKIEIIEFRKKLSQLKNIEKKRFILTTHIEKYKKVYQEELVSGAFRIRESHGKTSDEMRFISTKMRNSLDYADAAIRYFRATGIFKLSATTFRLQVLDQKSDLVKEILYTFPREPLSFENKSQFLDFLGNPDLPVLPDDRPEILQAEVIKLVESISSKNLLEKDRLNAYRHEKLVSASVRQLKESRNKLEKVLSDDLKEIQKSALQSYSFYDDIVEMYDKIVHRADYDIPDKPLFFEWNTWRAFVMLNDGEIICNALLDSEGKPLSTAPGGMPDGIGYY